jgi:hypothetical protein
LGHFSQVNRVGNTKQKIGGSNQVVNMESQAAQNSTNTESHVAENSDNTEIWVMKNLDKTEN